MNPLFLSFLILLGVLLLFRLNWILALFRTKKSKVVYRSARQELAPKYPLIFIPGILGIKLFDPEHQAYVWGGSKEILFRNPQHASYRLNEAQPLIANEQIHTFPVIPHLLELLISWEMRGTLENALGYKENRDLFFLGYDWRKDYRLLAQRIQFEIKKVQEHFGPHQKVILLGQSMSNLGIRYLLRTAEPSLRNSIARWYCFGPPWRGTYNSIKLLEKGYHPASRAFYGFTFDDIVTYPSCFQLLPNTLRLWTAEGQEIEDTDIYSRETWWKYNLSNVTQQNLGEAEQEAFEHALKDAKKFAEEIRGTSPLEQQISQVWFASDHNWATQGGVYDQGKVFLEAKILKKRYPHLLHKTLARGDDHIPLSHLTQNPCGPLVRNYRHIPYGENYILVGQPSDHRTLVNSYRPNIQALIQDILHLRKREKNEHSP
jgi:hypothetical protein